MHARAAPSPGGGGRSAARARPPSVRATRGGGRQAGGGSIGPPARVPPEVGMTIAAAQRLDFRSIQRSALALGTLATLGAVAAVLIAFHVPDPPVRSPDGLSVARAIGVALYTFVG